MYTKSIYNVYFENFDHEGIIFNTFHGTILRISKKQLSNFNQQFKNLNSCKNINLLNYLEDQGFIVRDSDEEIDSAMQRRNSYLHNYNTFILTIMPTESCNFRCPYCFESYKCNKMDDITEKKIISFVRNILLNYNTLSINWYGGEPLLRMDIIERLSSQIKSICRNNKKPFVASITTNGYFLTYENYLKLKACNVISYAVTLDGLPEYHNKTRILADGKPTFDTIISNLKQIQKFEKSHLISINIRTNYTSESIKCKSAWEDYLTRNFLYDKRFKYIPRFAWNNVNSRYEANKFLKFEFNDNINILHEITKDINIEAHENNIRVLSKVDGLEFAKQHIQSLVTGATICPAGCCNSIVLGVDGSAYKCQVALDSPKNKVGALNDNGSINFNENLKYWIKQESIFDSKQRCVQCVLFPLCGGIGCAAKTNSPQNVERIWCKQLLDEVRKCLHILTYYKEYLNIENII